LQETPLPQQQCYQPYSDLPLMGQQQYPRMPLPPAMTLAAADIIQLGCACHQHNRMAPVTLTGTVAGERIWTIFRQGLDMLPFIANHQHIYFSSDDIPNCSVCLLQ